jgi:hypothetical protein
MCYLTEKKNRGKMEKHDANRLKQLLPQTADNKIRILGSKTEARAIKDNRKPQ